MNNRQEVFNEMKRMHLDMTVPDTLDDAIKRGTLEGKRLSEKRASTAKGARPGAGFRVMAGAAAAMMILILSLNLSPAFADRMSGIPILGQLVKVLIFTNGSAEGGEITDGSDVSGVSAVKSGESEYFTIHFQQGELPQDIAGAYTVQYAKHPDTLSFQLSGVRMFSAAEDFDALKGSSLVEDVYPIITMDDSMVRFMIVFKEPVVYEVKEMKEPASLVIQVTPGGKQDEDVPPYRLRTAEMPRGESLAIAEEMLMNAFPQRRILHVAQNSENYYIELGQFATKADAQKALEVAKAASPDAGPTIEEVPARD